MLILGSGDFLFMREEKGAKRVRHSWCGQSFLLGSVLFCLGHILSLCMTICINNTLCVILSVI